MADFVTRRYMPGDERGILEMFNEVFHQNRELPSWYWKYRENPYGSYAISLVLAADGRIAAHYAGYPVTLFRQLPGERRPREIRTYQLGDKMSRREFRSAGFGRRALIARAYEHFKNNYMDDTIPFAYGFAAHHSHRFGVKVLRYQDVEPVPYRKAVLSRLDLPAAGAVKRTLSRITTHINPVIDEQWTAFFDRVAPHYGYLVKRDAPYLKWRYIERPDRDYLIISVRKRSRLTGWSVFFRDQERIIWGDALFEPNDGDSMKSLLRSLKSHPISRGAETLEGWFSPRPLWWDALLGEVGLALGSEPHGIRFVVPIWSDPLDSERLRQSFYYTMGDSDLF